MAVLSQSFFVGRFHAIQLSTLPKNLVDAKHLRAVRVVLGLTLGVVFAVNRCPCLGGHARGQPQPKAEEMRW